MRGLWLSVVAVMVACHDAPATRQPETPAKGAPVATVEAVLACCASADELERLAGQRVRLVGVYQAMVISQRGDAKPDLTEAGTAGVLSDGGLVILGVYHRPDGVRSIDERQRHDGKRVEVVGVVERRTPVSTAPDGQPAATMIGPYVRDIESISLID
jgi:hypothetical protein